MRDCSLIENIWTIFSYFYKVLWLPRRAPRNSLMSFETFVSIVQIFVGKKIFLIQHYFRHTKRTVSLFNLPVDIKLHRNSFRTPNSSDKCIPPDVFNRQLGATECFLCSWLVLIHNVIYVMSRERLCQKQHEDHDRLSR